MRVAQIALASFVGMLGTMPVAAFFGKAIRSATEYQTALIDMGRVTKVPFAELDKRVKALDPILGNATQLMQGYYQVISAGVTDVAKAQEVLTDAAKLGKLAHIDQAEAVKALTKIMAGYDGEIRNTVEAVDSLITIERLGQTTVAELIPVIGEIGNMAHLAGLKVNEMGGALSLVTQTAGSTAQAVTQLKTLIKSIIKPTELMSEAFDTKFKSTPMEYVKQHGFIEFLKELKDLGGTQTGVSKMLGGRQEGLLAWSALQARDFERLGWMIEEMEKKGGAFSTAWNQYTKGMESQWDKFKNTVYNFAKDLGGLLLPSLTDSVIGLTAGLRGLVDVGQEMAHIGELVGFQKYIDLINMLGGFGPGAGPDFSQIRTAWINWKKGMIPPQFSEEADFRETNLRGWRGIPQEGEWKPYQNFMKAEAEYLKALQGQIDKVNTANKTYREEMEKITPLTKEMAMTKLDTWFRDQYKELKVITPELQKLYDLYKKQILGSTPREAIGESMKSLLQDASQYSMFAYGAIERLGIDKDLAGKMFQEGLFGKANKLADDLVEQFDNPYMKQIFGTVMENLGKHGGNALLEELGKTLRGAENKFETFKSKMETYKTELEKYEEARKTLAEKLASGEAQQLVFGNGIAGYVEKIGMKYGENPEKGSFGEFFNAPIWGNYQEIKAPVMPVEPKDTLEFATSELMKKLPEGLKGVQAQFEDIFKPLEKSINELIPVGVEAGKATGKALGDQIEEGANEAIERVKRALRSLPESVDLRELLSGQLAQELMKAGREE